MRDETRAVFQLLQNAIEHWSDAAGHRDAYVRGSQARKDLAEQIVAHRRMRGRKGFMDKLREWPQHPNVLPKS
jgi:hypothetical protein